MHSVLPAEMYPAGDGQADRSGNCHAGTVIDNEITHPYYADFYLMSHAGLLGTSRATHYTVLLDEARLGPDQLQATAFHLAHIYARSTRSVSIAAPAYYAHHVCFRARHHVGDDDSAMSDVGSASAEQMDQLRNQKLDTARAKLSKGIGASLKDSLYFM
jgi:eukaryotic translation initiation factor 2C